MNSSKLFDSCKPNKTSGAGHNLKMPFQQCLIHVFMSILGRDVKCLCHCLNEILCGHYFFSNVQVRTRTQFHCPDKADLEMERGNAALRPSAKAQKPPAPDPPHPTHKTTFSQPK